MTEEKWGQLKLILNGVQDNQVPFFVPGLVPTAARETYLYSKYKEDRAAPRFKTVQ